MSRLKKEILSKLKEYAGKMGKDHLGGDDSPSPKRGGLRDFDGYDNVDYNQDMPMDEDSPESAHPQGSKKLTNRTTVMDMLDVISHKEFGPDYHKLSTKQKKEVHKLAIKGKLIKQSPFKESVNEAKVETERYFGKKGIIIMIRDGNKMISAIFKDKKNADKFNRNNPADVKKLLQLAKKTKYPKAIDESVNEAKVNYNFSEDELKRVLKLLGRSASTEVKMIKAFEKAFGRKLTRDELFESINEGMFSMIDQIRQDSKDVRDFVKNVFKDKEFKKMSNDKDFIKYLKSIYEGVDESLDEKNVPTDPSKWSYYKGQAKKKFDVYPSAYANGWAAKKYKAAGGGWKKEK